MPKLSNVGFREIASFLRIKGFTLDHTTGSHAVFYNDFTKKRAVVPRRSKDLPKGTILSILNETGFGRDDLIEFLNS